VAWQAGGRGEGGQAEAVSVVRHSRSWGGCAKTMGGCPGLVALSWQIQPARREPAHAVGARASWRTASSRRRLSLRAVTSWASSRSHKAK
jgi:hypothetical protein